MLRLAFSSFDLLKKLDFHRNLTDVLTDIWADPLVEIHLNICSGLYGLQLLSFVDESVTRRPTDGLRDRPTGGPTDGPKDSVIDI